MTDAAIVVDRLGKVYRLGQTTRGYRTLRDSIAELRRPRTDEDRLLWALRDVTFDVDRGEAIGVIGRNGAGKSTLLKILSRITVPTEGQAMVHGRVGSLLEVGTGFHAELTGRENVYLNGAILGMRRAEIQAKFDEIVEFSEVERFIDTPVKRYSSGMYVRLAFAVAAHLDTEVLLVDEVLSVGDLSFQRKCLGKMQDQTSQEGRTVLFVSHNLGSIKNLTSKTVWIDHGGVRACGETNAVVQEYVNAHGGSGASGEADLSDIAAGRPHKRLEQEVVFESVALRTPEGLSSELHLEGAPIQVDIRMRCLVESFRRPLEIWCRLRTIEGVWLFATSTGLQEVDLGEAVYETSFVIDPNPFTPGSYDLHLYATSGLAQDLVPSAIRFQIEPNPGEDEDARYDLIGLVRVRFPWRELAPAEPIGRP